MASPLSNIQVRQATLSDLDALQQLEQAGFPSDRFKRRQFRYLLRRAQATTFVLERCGQVLAAAILLWRKRALTARLYSIVVDPGLRGQGVGQRLLQACEREARARACIRMSLEVRVDNTQAIAFYREQGFCALATLPRYYEDGTDGLKMAKKLQ